MLAQNIRKLVQIIPGEALIGVHAQPDIGTKPANEFDACPIRANIAVEFQLYRFSEIQRGDSRLEIGWVVRRQGESRGERAWPRNSGERPDRRARKLGIELPKCAVEGVPRAACRECALKLLAVHPRLYCRANILDRRDH